MRIRTIKPEFWRSDDVAALPMDVRLLFVGLWSYVDDNGVGIDDPRQIAADLFALEDDPAAIRAFVREGLATLSRGFQVIRYQVAGKRYLFITNWDKHQRIDKPAKPRYPRPEPLPTSPNESDHDPFTTPSRHLRDVLAPGTGEQGNRGTDNGAAPSATTDRAHDPEPIPTGPAITGPTAVSAKHLVQRHIGPEITATTRTALAIEVGKLITHYPEHVLAEALNRWKGRTGISPRLLPSLVDDIVKEHADTNRPVEDEIPDTIDRRTLDELLGEDYWKPPTPPRDIDEGPADQRAAWYRDRGREHHAERVAEARALLTRRRTRGAA